jgi:hypothetical protein
MGSLVAFTTAEADQLMAAIFKVDPVEAALDYCAFCKQLGPRYRILMNHHGEEVAYDNELYYTQTEANQEIKRLNRAYRLGESQANWLRENS